MCSGPVVFSSKKLKHTSPQGAASHFEYMGLAQCNQAVVWIRQLLQELGFNELVDKPTRVYGDNKAANGLCSEPLISSGNQYIYLPYHFNKEVVELGFVEVCDVRTKMNIADLFTKPVGADKMREMNDQMLGYKFIPYEIVDQGYNASKNATFEDPTAM